MEATDRGKYRSNPSVRLSLRSLHVVLRRPETMKIDGERSATSAGCATFSEESFMSRATP